MLLFTPVLLSGQPSNDSCSDAAALTVGTSCMPQQYSCIGATSESASVAPDPDCGLYEGADVWFTFVVPDDGAFRIETSDVQPISASWALYSGSCGDFETVECKMNRPGNFDLPESAGETLYLRVWRTGSISGNLFSLCVFEITPPSNDNCADAIELDIDENCTPANFSGEFATAEPPSVAPEPSCGFYAGGDVWFKFTAPPEGRFEIVKNQNISELTVVEGYSGSCGNFELILCSFTISEIEIDEPDLGGQEIYLRVFAPQSADGSPFDLCVRNLSVPDNDVCSDAVAIPVGDTCNPEIYHSYNASDEAPMPSCWVGSSGSVWFTVEVPDDGKMRIQRDDMTGSIHYMGLFRNGCDGFLPVACELWEDYIDLDNASLGGSTLHLVVYRFASGTGGTFSLCAVTYDCADTPGGTAFTDDCGDCVGGNTGEQACAPCNVSGGTITTTDPVGNLCVGDGFDNFISVQVTGTQGVGRFGLTVAGTGEVVAGNSSGTFNMENYPPGNYSIRHVAADNNSVFQGVTNGTQLSGCFSMSNSISVSTVGLNGGGLSADGPTSLCGGGVSFSVNNAVGPNTRFVMLNQAATEIVTTNNTGVFNFNNRPPGTYRVVHIAYSDAVNLGTVEPPTVPACMSASNQVVIQRLNCSALSAGPNPADRFSRVTFSTAAGGEATLEVYDLSGRIVDIIFRAETYPGTDYGLDFNTASIPNGVYLYRLSTREGVLTEKFIVAH